MSKSGKRISWKMIQEAEEQVIKRKKDRIVPLMIEEREKLKKASLKKGIKVGLQKGLQEGLLKGHQEGMQEVRKEVVLKMLKEEMDLQLISKITGLSKREINKLKK